MATEEKKADEAVAEEDVDERIEFLLSYIIRTMRIKQEKWSKMMQTEEYSKVIMDFLNKENVMALFLAVNSGGGLIPDNHFKGGGRSKTSYFIKKRPAVIDMENLIEVVVFGDMSWKPVDELAVLCEHIFLPLTSCYENTKDWPHVLQEDIRNQIIKFNKNLYQVRGAFKGLTLLPMPHRIDNIYDAISRFEEGGEVVESDLQLKLSIESAIAQWANIVNTVLKQSPLVSFANQSHPGPLEEIKFWESRLKNLTNIYNQLRDPRVKKLILYAELCNSNYLSFFQDTFKNVVAGIVESRDITLYLNAAKPNFERIEECDLLDMVSQLGPVMHVIGLIWANSRYYCSIDRIVVLLQQTSNALIGALERAIDPGSIFQGEPDEIHIKIDQCLDLIALFEKSFYHVRATMPNNFPPDVEPIPWKFHSRNIFQRMYEFRDRLILVNSILQVALEYFKLEKVEFAGLKGRNLSTKCEEILQEFNNTYIMFSRIQYEVLDLSDSSIVRDHVEFMAKVKDLDKRLAAIFLLSFEECSNLESYFKLIGVMGTLAERPIIAKEISICYEEMVDMYDKELDNIKSLYDEGMVTVPFDRNFPPVAGRMWWLNKLKMRLVRQTDDFKQVDHVAMASEEAKYALQKYDQMLNILIVDEENTFNNWVIQVPGIIAKHIVKTLVKRGDKGLLQMNFAEELEEVLREVRYLLLLESWTVPAEALTFFARMEEITNTIQNLMRSIEWYNHIFASTIEVEYNMIVGEIVKIDELVENAITTLTWEADHFDQINEFHELIHNLYLRVQRAQNNIKAFEDEIDSVCGRVLYNRKNNDPCELIFLENRDERTSRRYRNIARAGRHLIKMLRINYYLYYNIPIPEENLPPEAEEGYQVDELEEENQEVVTSPSEALVLRGNLSAALPSVDSLPIEDPVYNNAFEDERFLAYLDYIDDLAFAKLLAGVLSNLEFFMIEMDENIRCPLFSILLELHDVNIIAIPSIDNEVDDNFMTFVYQLLEDIFLIADTMPEILPTKGKHFMEDIAGDPAAMEMKAEIMSRTYAAVQEIVKYLEEFEEYEYLWIDSRKEFMEMFIKYGRILTPEELMTAKDPIGGGLKETPPTMEQFKEQIELFEAVYRKIELIDKEKIINHWLLLDVSPLRQTMLNIAKKWSNMFKQHLYNQVIDSITELETFIIEAIALMQTPLAENDFDGLIKVMGCLSKVRDRQYSTDNMFEPLWEIIKMLGDYNMTFTDDIIMRLQELPEKWQNCKKVALTTRQIIAPLQANQVNAIKKRIQLFDIRQTIFTEKFKKSELFMYNCKNVYKKLDQFNESIQELEASMAKLTEQGNLFELQIPEFKHLKMVRTEIKMLKALWDYVLMCRSWIDEWKDTPWKRIDVEAMDMECKKFGKDLRAMDKELRSWNLYTQMEATIKNLLTSLRAVTELQNPAIRDRHWQQLMQATKVKFVMDDSTTLNDLLALNLHEYEEEVKTIVDKSVKEMAMEKVLKELNAVWTTMEFGQETHQRTNLKLLMVTEELIETLEDHQVQLQNMLTSKFIDFFFDEVSDWQKKLSNADQVISVFMEVQRKWGYLESIFIGSEDIRNQLPEDSRRFDKIDREFKEALAEMIRILNVIKATNRPGLYERLEAILEDLTLCEKALNDYLETKRLAFPRFYFVSSADLLDILSTGNQPELVQRHLTKLFDSLARLRWEGPKVANAMLSKENDETVPFAGLMECVGKVETWLNKLIDIMRKTLHKYFGEAISTYEGKARDVWIFDYPAQPALCGTQIWWTTETNIALGKLEEGYENALKDYNKKQINQLYVLILHLLGDLSAGDRQKIMTICTIDVHSRDVISKMIVMKVENSQAFQWQSQLRHRWDLKQKDCFANICDAQFKYQYEYLGNTPRLVITPLTDRCYITLTQSLHLIMGGAPAGPAGTGKTETTKDLGKALGIMVYVFNCSEQMDYKSVGNIYKGLAQTGTWGCFDEFNRISIEVLSVVAVQVKTIQDAIKDRKARFRFLGEEITLFHTVGIFITMNPGYAGRTELPENLKAQFRPCAMVVPDFELICEIMLVAEGFQDARLLARKFITLYSLCRELLSKQDHYDWGLRAIKSVLVVAGALKRSDRQRPEDQVLMRALRDFNIPKIITDDVPVFMGLIGDLFPSLDVPRKRLLEFEKMIKKSAVDLKLQPEDGFVLKIVQLEELFAVRHSVFVIGYAGTGKSMVWKTLNKTYQNQKRRPVYNDLNPKAVTNDELFGIINPSTREWKDGLFSVIMREQANLTGDGPKWIILDGDIDPMWIESLNTLMDDNKVLTLASNERIALTTYMRLLFEIANLRSATPATVSRAGILYINPKDLGWNPYVASWIDTRTIQSEKALLGLLFDKYVPPCLEVVRIKVKKITPLVDVAHISMLCNLLDCFLTPQNVPADCPKEWYEIYFVFCIVWAFGSSLFQDQIVDWRNEFSKWFTNEFKAVRFPSQGTVFHYYIDEETKKFLPWADIVNEFELDSDVPLQATLVNTAETTRVRFFLDHLMAKRVPCMLVGNAGCGKSVLVQSKIDDLPDAYQVQNVPFNFYTSSEMLQKILEKPLEKKAGRVYGPPGNKQMIYFVDDMNMPEVDKYFTVQPHTLLRQHIDYQHWYDRQKLTLKDIHNVQYVSCMNPTAGSFTIDPRLQRHFCVFALSFPSQDALYVIYHSILKQHLVSLNFPMPIHKQIGPVVNAAVQLATKMSTTFLPTAVKFHYIFNLRDVSNIFQGMLFVRPDGCRTPSDFIRLWMHESVRVYGDKLTEAKDIETFHKLIYEVTKKGFEEMDENTVMEKPLIFCHFAEGMGDPKYSQIRDFSHLNKLLLDALAGYNDLVSAMNLVLFEDAMNHICRINRIMEAPRGNALLVGVGGSGKQSLTRLASFISSLDVFQIQLKKGYSITDMKADISTIYLKAGIKSVSSTFLMTDSQVPQENYLVVINDMLASGEIPDLLQDEDIENIMTVIRSEVKAAGMEDSREICWKFFINKVRRLLKIVLCFSPVGATLRIRARKFPALVNCTAINWFHEWPKEALLNVSKRFLAEIHTLPAAYVENASQFMSYVHVIVNEVSQNYLALEKRYNYTTPKTFLEQIALYAKLLTEKTNGLKHNILRLENGLLKLASTSEEVDGLQEVLAVQEVELASKNEAADKLIKVLGAENEKVAREQAFASEEEAKVKAIEEDVAVKAKVCAEDLSKAEPALKAAAEALNTLNKNNLTELKSFGSPPEAVVNVCAAVLVLFSPKGKIPKDRSWKSCKIIMGKVDQFLNDLVYYDKENMHPEVVKAVQPYVRDPEFDPKKIMSKSTAAAGLCAWVINIVRFYDVFLVVEPKRKALAKATTDLNNARQKLKDLNEKLTALEKQLSILRSDFEEATDEKLKCQALADATATMIDLARRLINGLASEKVRWRDSVTNFRSQIITLPGDILLVTAFVSYVGCFTRKYRGDLVNNHWIPFLTKLETPIPMSEGLDPLGLLTDDAMIAKWNNEGLPTDRMSSENATILSNTARWPLMIDPQLQGVKWIKNRYGDLLTVLRLTQKNYLDTLERCLSYGNVVLLENIGETIDAVLDPILGRVLIKKGKAIKIGDKEIDYDHRFRLIIQTKLANPHYKPEIQAQTTLINFTVTRDGLEEQLLAEVVKNECPDLEQLKSSLTKQQNDFKITLKTCEDNLLERLSSATGNILGDVALVTNLETTKKTAAEIEVKAAEAKITSVKIDEAREQYRPASARASLLYFILNDLNRINAIYQFSLKAFTVVFKYALGVAETAEKLKERVANLLDSITFCVFMYTSRGLFESDKLIFLAQMTFQILLYNDEIAPVELDFLLRFPIMANMITPFDFLSNVLWGGVKALVNIDEFRGLDKDMEGSSKRWKKYAESECPEKEKLPGEWKNKTMLQRLCILRCLRPDRMTYAITLFIEEKLGSKFITARTVPFEKSYEETSNSTPTFFILSPGVNPLKDVEKLGKKLGFTFDKGNFHSVALGQGQEIVAENAMDIAAEEGHWVILQNIHLVSRWLGQLEKKMEQTNENSHENYRLYLSAEAAADPTANVLPQGILESAIKITNEPPTGMFANLHKAFDNFTQETLEMCSKESEFKAILFSLCYFHAVVAERRKFGAQGWNRNYPFNVGDLTISVNVLYNYLENNNKVPWEDLRYLFGEIMYGGHITDDWDRRLCKFYLLEYLQPLLLEGDLFYAPGFQAPGNRDYIGYHKYIDDNLPPESPYLYGLHPNAEIGFLTNITEIMFKTIFEMQPRDAGASGGGGMSREDKVKSVLDDIFDKLPEMFNIREMMAKIEDRTPYIIVCFQECDRMNMLTTVMKTSLKELDLGLKGELTITPDMEVLESELFMDNVPEAWAAKAYPSLLPLGQWFSDLSLRIKELENWTTDFAMPLAVWLGGFFNPQSFLTAIMQQTARKNEWPLDKMCLLADVTRKQREDIIAAPREGANVHGLYMEGARWDSNIGSIAESILKDLFPVLPVIYLKAITQDKQDLRNMYDCPVYKTRMRGPTFVWTFNLKTKERASKWVLAGVAILLGI